MTDPQAEPAQLQGITVLVTRPVHQADSLCQRLVKYGARVVRFPLLEIQEPVDLAPLKQAADQLEKIDWAIFVSANAVQRAVPVILARRSWPVKTRIAVIGKSSSAALQPYGLIADACPEDQYDSEGLLALPAMHEVMGKRMVIFRGNGGRETLAKSLRSRGASIEYVECYRRVKPALGSHNPDELGKITRVDVVLINSADSLHNFVELFSGATGNDLFDLQLLVVSRRLVEVVQQAGFVKPPLVADNATDEAVIETLLAWGDQPGLRADI